MSLKGFRVLAHVSGGGRYKLGSDLVASTGAAPAPPPAETFHLLTEGGNFLVTEAGDFLDIEHV